MKNGKKKKTVFHFVSLAPHIVRSTMAESNTQPQHSQNKAVYVAVPVEDPTYADSLENESKLPTQACFRMNGPYTRSGVLIGVVFYFIMDWIILAPYMDQSQFARMDHKIIIFLGWGTASILATQGIIILFCMALWRCGSQHYSPRLLDTTILYHYWIGVLAGYFVACLLDNLLGVHVSTIIFTLGSLVYSWTSRNANDRRPIESKGYVLPMVIV